MIWWILGGFLFCTVAMFLWALFDLFAHDPEEQARLARLEHPSARQ